MYRMLRYVLSMLALLLVVEANGQYSEKIRSARPSRVPGVFTNGKGIIQIQTGIDFEETKSGATSIDRYVAQFLLRLGTGEKIDIRLGVVYRNDRFGTIESTAIRGIQDFFVGARFNLREGHGFSPTVGLQLHYHFFKILSPQFERSNTAPDITLVTHQVLAQGLSLTSNLGAIWNGNNSIPTWRYGFRLSKSVGSQWQILIDHIGSVTAEQYSYNFGVGLGYFVTNDFKLDLSAVSVGGQNQSSWLFSVGLSWRYLQWRK